MLCSCGTRDLPDRGFATAEKVGRIGTNQCYTPANQVLAPAGIQIDLPGLRPQAVAESPDGKLLLVSGKTAQLVVIDPSTAQVMQRVPLPGNPDKEEKSEAPVSSQILKPDKEGQVSFTGLVFSPDGKRIYFSSVLGTIKVFAVESGKVQPLRSFSLPPATAPERKTEIPAGLAVSRDGKRLYVAFNLSNRAAELDCETGRVIRQWEVGVAPYDVAVCGTKLYVSNWGGRRPGTNSLTGPAGRGTTVRVDPVRHIASEGSVSVIELGSGSEHAGVREVVTGMRAAGLAVAPDGRHVVVANSGSDTLSVIDSRTDKIVETIWARQSPADQFGAQPNAIAFEPSGKRMFVCNGSQNAVAVFDFKPGSSKLAGLIPSGWFPGAIVYDAHRKMLHVANIKGLGPGTSRKDAGPKFNTHQYHGSVSIIEVPGRRDLARCTAEALANMRYPLLREAAKTARKNQAARPVPERSGEPSVFKHVVYIIKENRTYDQVLGDMPEGNGDKDLCIFGERVTPNQHKLAREFVLLDNTYCSGILSADGHQWADTAITTDYMERSFAGFPRSYPDGMEDSDVDALAYSPAGFIWDSAIAGGKSLRVYGEFAITEASWRDGRKQALKFLDFYSEFANGTSNILIWSRPGVESLRPYLATNTVGWDMRIPDVFRAARFVEELKGFERSGNFPNLSIICLPNNHTSGTQPGAPTPAAQVADNDLALGQIVEAISRSRFWPETCIFIIEDDPQNGWDHVSGYRTAAFVISPYTKRGEVVSTQYNQTSLLRTIGLILGLPPMNQMDATATPMSDCFTDKPDITPFGALPNIVPLDEMNPEPKAIKDPLLRRNAIASARLPLDKVDRCPEDLLNRILWHAIKGSTAAYPAWAVRLEGPEDE